MSLDSLHYNLTKFCIPIYLLNFSVTFVGNPDQAEEKSWLLKINISSLDLFSGFAGLQNIS